MKKILLLFLAILISACGETVVAKKNENVKFPDLKDISQKEWNKLAQSNIYFGHQSVGFNILDGIKDIINENSGIKLNIVETDSPEYAKPALAHSRVGSNEDPKSKCDAFKGLVMQNIGSKADIVFFKLCYIDIVENTNIEDVFAYYKKTIKELQSKYPKLKIIHFTVPLKTSPTDIINKVKRWVDISIYEDKSNIKRNKFNKLLLKEYEGREPVFDLAKVESTYPDGQRETLGECADMYYTLVPAYTNDGGHLNEKGRKKVAEQLLIFLAKMT